MLFQNQYLRERERERERERKRKRQTHTERHTHTHTRPHLSPMCPTTTGLAIQPAGILEDSDRLRRRRRECGIAEGSFRPHHRLSFQRKRKLAKPTGCGKNSHIHGQSGQLALALNTINSFRCEHVFPLLVCSYFYFIDSYFSCCPVISRCLDVSAIHHLLLYRCVLEVITGHPKKSVS